MLRGAHVHLNMRSCDTLSNNTLFPYARLLDEQTRCNDLDAVDPQLVSAHQPSEWTGFGTDTVSIHGHLASTPRNSAHLADPALQCTPARDVAQGIPTRESWGGPSFVIWHRKVSPSGLWLCGNASTGQRLHNTPQRNPPVPLRHGRCLVNDPSNLPDSSPLNLSAEVSFW